MKTKLHLELTASIERNDREIDIVIEAEYSPEVRSGYRSYDPPEYEEMEIVSVKEKDTDDEVKLTPGELRKFGAQLLAMGRAESRNTPTDNSCFESPVGLWGAIQSKSDGIM